MMMSSITNNDVEMDSHVQGQQADDDSASRRKTTGRGISIEEAMSILSTRAENGSEKELRKSSSSNGTVDPNLKQMGQVLDLIGTQEWTGGGEKDKCNHTSSSSPLVMHERQEMAKQSRGQQNDGYRNDGISNDNDGASDRNQKALKLKETLSKQTPYELLQTLFKIQNERVLTYKKFNDGLDQVLKSRNFSQYTTLATNITASFVVLSNSIREIQRLFQEQDNGGGKGEIASFIQQLQSHEKEQLHLTAALHLEKMRERNEVIDMNIGGSGDGNGNEKIAHLLRESIASLQGKIAECIENINDVLEELRYAAADLNE